MAKKFTNDRDARKYVITKCTLLPTTSCNVISKSWGLISWLSAVEILKNQKEITLYIYQIYTSNKYILGFGRANVTSLLEDVGRVKCF